jgi:anti-sigma B factor antagonist
VIGELDLATAPNLANVLASLTDVSFEQVVLDLDGVSFMDTSGLDALLRCRAECAHRGVSMHLRRVSRPAQRVIDLTGSAAVLGL